MTKEDLIHHLERKINHYNLMLEHGLISQIETLSVINLLTELIHNTEPDYIGNIDLIKF